MDLLNYEDEMICPACNGVGRIKKRDKRVSDLTVAEAFELMIKAVKECKKQDAEQAEIEYRKLTGTKVPQEF